MDIIKKPTHEPLGHLAHRFLHLPKGHPQPCAHLTHVLYSWRSVYSPDGGGESELRQMAGEHAVGQGETTNLSFTVTFGKTKGRLAWCIAG